MNTRLPQDAADSLFSYESQQAWRNKERARWAAAQPQKIVAVWAPRMEPHERQAFERYAIENNLPF